MAASMEEEPPKEIKQLLKDYPDLCFQKSNQKIRCMLSGHEMPSKADAIKSYVNGKKFVKLLKDKEFNYDRFKPHIIPNTKKRHEHQLFCLLTLSHINKTPRHVQAHVNGRKYKKELERWNKCQESGEKYVPQRAMKRKRRPDVEAEGGKSFLDSDAESNASDDSYSDLYPPEHFGGLEEDVINSDSSYEFEDLIEESGSEKKENSKDTKDLTSLKQSSTVGTKKKKSKTKKLKK